MEYAANKEGKVKYFTFLINIFFQNKEEKNRTLKRAAAVNEI